MENSTITETSDLLKENLDANIPYSTKREGKDIQRKPLEEFKCNTVSETEKEDINKAVEDAIVENDKDLLNEPNPIEQVRARVAKKITAEEKIKKSKEILNKKSMDWSIISRTAEAAKKGATTLAAASVGKAVLHASFSTVYDTCDVALSKNKKKALAKVLPGVAVSLIPGVGLLAGIGLSMASGYLGGKAYDKVLSSRTVEIHHTLFLPDILLSNIDDSIIKLKVKVMQMGIPYYGCRPAIVDLTLRTEEFLEDKIKSKFEEIEAEINSVVIENLSVDSSANAIKKLIKKIESWYDSLCTNLQQLEQYIETLLIEEPTNLIKIQEQISQTYDDLVEVITKEVPEALKEGMKQMQLIIKAIQA